MYRELTLDEIKQIELNILKHFKAYCEENDICFLLSNGTLLGAVKYQGFIPWDDDIDVFVPREDYDKLIVSYTDSKKYKLFSHERNENFYFPFAKLCDMETRKIEGGVENGTPLGLDIDIFPLDYWGNTEAEAEKKLKTMKSNLAKLNFSKMEFSRGKNYIRTVVKWILIHFYKMTGSAKYTKKMIIEASAAKMEKSEFAGCVVWPIYGEKEILPSHVFAETTEVTFEGDSFAAPAGYDQYLRSLYGNYEEDPPEDKQCTHHNFKAYN